MVIMYTWLAYFVYQRFAMCFNVHRTKVFCLCMRACCASHYNQSSRWHCICHNINFLKQFNYLSSFGNWLTEAEPHSIKWAESCCRRHHRRSYLPRVCSMYVTRITYVAAINSSVQHQKCVALVFYSFFCSAYKWLLIVCAWDIFPRRKTKESL